MKLSLGKKLFLSNGITFAVILAVTLFILERGQARQWEQHLYSQSQSFATFATPELLKYFGGSFHSGHGAFPEQGFDLLSVNRDLVAFNIISPSGRPLYQSPRFPDYIDNSLPKAFSSEKQPASTSSWLNNNGEAYLMIIHPAYGPTGSHLIDVRYLFSFHSVNRRVAEIRAEFLRFTVPTIILVLSLVWFISRRMSLPVKALTIGAQKVEQGDLSVRVERTTDDEVGQLTEAFNRMTIRLEEHRRELTEKNESLLEVQQQLIRSERLAVIGQLAAGVSHEIDNPVGIILGHAELMKLDLEDGSPLHEDIDEIIAECRRCKKITGGLLGFARTESHLHESFDPKELIGETISSLKTQKLFQQIEVSVAATSEYHAKGDRDQVRQILINLLINSAQAMQGNGTISIATELKNSMLSINVTDSGPGIPENLAEKIFEPFFSTKASNEGTGLGLALCRKLAEEMGGRLIVTPSNEGGIFTLDLPLSRTA